jgi:hypothetical protein
LVFSNNKDERVHSKNYKKGNEKITTPLFFAESMPQDAAIKETKYYF